MPERRDRYPEEKLIVGLLSEQAVGGHPPDSVKKFLGLCELHGVSGIILDVLQGRGLSGGAWQEIIESLQATRRQWLARNIYLMNRLRSFSSTLRRAGISCIVLKGGSLLAVLYSDFGLRPLMDVDVLIRRNDLDRILDLLERDGWALPAEEDISYYRKNFYHLDVRTQDAFSALFELHWNLDKDFRQFIEIDELWERSVRFHLEKEPFLRLSNDDLMLHLLIHLAYHHYYSSRLIWVYDIRELIRRSSLDWDRILARTDRWGLRVPVHYSLKYVDKIFPGVVPPEILERVRGGWVRRLLLRAVAASDPMLLTPSVEGNLLRWTTSLYFIEKPGDIVRYVWKNVGPKMGRLSRSRKGAGRPGRPLSP